MARTKRANRYCVDCGSRLVYYPRLSNPKAPNEYRVLVYACPDCSNDFDRPKMFSIKRNQVENPLETVEIEIKQVQNNFKIIQKNNKVYLEPERQRSNWWYLLPIFLGIIGGIIAYFALRNDDRQKAKKCLYLGLILGAIGIFFQILFAEIPIEEQFGVNI